MSFANKSELEDKKPSATEFLQDQTRTNALYRAITKLSGRQIDAVSMRQLDGMRFPDVFKLESLSFEAVKSLISRRKFKLLDILKSRKSELDTLMAEQDDDLKTELEMFSTAAKWQMPRPSEDLDYLYLESDI